MRRHNSHSIMGLGIYEPNPRESVGTISGTLFINFLPQTSIVFIPQFKVSLFPFARRVQLNESTVSGMVALYKLGNAFVDATYDSARSCVCTLTLACNLCLVVPEEGVPNSTDMAEFNQRVLKLSKAQLSFMFGNPVETYCIPSCGIHLGWEEEGDILRRFEVSVVLVRVVVVHWEEGDGGTGM